MHFFKIMMKFVGILRKNNIINIFGYIINGDNMEEKMIEVVVKESNIDNKNIPLEDSDEGKKLVQTVREETINSQ